MLEENQFEQRYRNGDTPWDHGRMDSNLSALVAAYCIRPCRVLDIGCGTGANAVWLAQEGFDVTGCDLSETAVEKARITMTAAGLRGTLLAGDFLQMPLPSESFDFAFDRGCLHCMPDAAARVRFAAKVADVLKPGGRWLCLAGNADEPKRLVGPPQLSATELIALVEPYFEVVSLTSGFFGSDQPQPPRAWVLMMSKRAK